MLAAPAAARADDAIAASVGDLLPGVGATVTVRGTVDAVDAPTLAWVKVRPDTGPCAPSYDDDAGAALTPSRGESVAAGSFTLALAWTPPAAGPYRLCSWLETYANGIAPFAADDRVIGVRSPNAAPMTIGVAAPPQADQAFPLWVSGTSELQRRVVVKVTPDGGAPCPGRADAAGERVLNAVVFGPFYVSATLREPAGEYLVCAYLVTSESDPAPVTAASARITVAAPAPPDPPPPPAPAIPVVQPPAAPVAPAPAPPAPLVSLPALAVVTTRPAIVVGSVSAVRLSARLGGRAWRTFARATPRIVVAYSWRQRPSAGVRVEVDWTSPRGPALRQQSTVRAGSHGWAGALPGRLFRRRAGLWTVALRLDGTVRSRITFRIR